MLVHALFWALCVASSVAFPTTDDTPIIGGSGDFRYQYMPDLVNPPPSAINMTNAHGLEVDADGFIYLTYDNDGKADKNCLIRWLRAIP